VVFVSDIYYSGAISPGLIISVVESPAKKWDLFKHIPLFIELPYLLPTIVAASITITGGLLSLTLDRDGGPRSGAPSSETNEPLDSTIEAEAGLAVPGSSLLCHPGGYSSRRITESSPLQQTSGGEDYGTIEPSTPATEQTEARLGVPLGERTWTQSSAISGGSGYGDLHRSRFGIGARHGVSTASWTSAVARRRMGTDEGMGEMYTDIETDEREPRLAERILMGEFYLVIYEGNLY
jgi:hypothetical protein